MRFQEIVNRALVGQGPVTIGVCKEEPAVAGPPDDDGELVIGLAVAVEVGGGRLTHRPFVHEAGVDAP